MRRAFVVINPMAGSSDVSAIEETLNQYASASLCCRVHVMTPNESATHAVRAVLPSGFDLIVAAGGDGTVASVASALVHAEVPLGIIPIGTGNVMARELRIPSRIDAAVRLLCEPHDIRTLDAIQVGERFFIMNIGIGVSAVMMRDTTTPEKRRYGRLAYIWRGIKALAGFQPQYFTFTIDGNTSQMRAAEFIVTNTAAAGDPAIRWGSHVRLDDGCLDICILRAYTALDYLAIAWNVIMRRQRKESRLHFLRAEHSVIVRSSRPLPVEGDGEFIGHTPVEIGVVPNAVKVIVPRATA